MLFQLLPVKLIKELKVLLFFNNPNIKVLVIRLILKMKVGVGLINEFVNSGLEARFFAHKADRMQGEFTTSHLVVVHTNQSVQTWLVVFDAGCFMSEQ